MASSNDPFNWAKTEAQFGGNRFGKSAMIKEILRMYSEMAEEAGIPHHTTTARDPQYKTEQAKRDRYREQHKEWHSHEKPMFHQRPPHHDKCPCPLCENYRLVTDHLAEQVPYFTHTPSCKCCECDLHRQEKEYKTQYNSIKRRCNNLREVMSGRRPNQQVIERLKLDVETLREVITKGYLYTSPFNSMRIISNSITLTSKDKCEQCSALLSNDIHFFNWYSQPYRSWLLTCKHCWQQGGSVLDQVKGFRFVRDVTNKNTYLRIV